MQYLGGKYRTSKTIIDFILLGETHHSVYLEPFVGGASVLEKIPSTFKRLASDVNPYLISLYKAVQRGWDPPKNVTEDEYLKAKNTEEFPKYLKGFIGVGCSFGGKWFGGYARSGKRNYAENARNSLIKLRSKIKDVKFKCISYDKLDPFGCIIYCDPPYVGTTKYNILSENFNYELFWNTMRNWAKRNTIYISEYIAPEDFKCVLEIKTKTDLHTKTGKEERIEKLWTYKFQ